MKQYYMGSGFLLIIKSIPLMVQHDIPPGSIVRCVKEIHDAEELLVAREAVADAAHKIAPIHESGLLTASESTANLRTRLS